MENNEAYFYRIYEVTTEEESVNYSFYEDRVIRRKLIDNGYIIAKDRDEFKSILKETYPDINFGRKKDCDIGYKYVTVIYHNKYDIAKGYIFDYECDNCKKRIYGDRFNLNTYLYNCSLWIGVGKRTDEKYKFCCEKCKNEYEERLKAEETQKNGNMLIDSYVDKNSWNNEKGYIYKISKKSTGEFYIGQTRYTPIFRWGQHLLSERFDIKNIDDYIFEVIEKCPFEKLNERESHYINLYKNDSRNLNKAIPNNYEQLALEVE
jgi:hypothetical protein